jgi:hypothetical protein
MDYAEQVKSGTNGSDFTYTEYRNLKRKPPKVETKPETKPEVGAETNATSVEADETGKCSNPVSVSFVQ